MIKVEERNSSFELLRIVAMIMIIFNHFAVHGHFNYGIEISFNSIWYTIMSFLGNIGVDLYILISGYFLIKSDKVEIKKLFKLWGEIIFYSLIISLIFSIPNLVYIKKIKLINIIIPVTTETWWFATTYFIMYIIHPYINKIIQKLDKKEHQVLILLTLFIWSIIPTITSFSLGSNNLLWFITLYIFASYIRLYDFRKVNKKYYILFALLIMTITVFSSVFTVYLSRNNFELLKYTMILNNKNSMTLFLVSIEIFLFFKNTNIKNNKYINAIAGTTFGIYLIHDHPYLREFLWLYFFKNKFFQNSNMLIIYSIAITLSVFLVCMIIDILRKKIFEPILLKIISKYEDKIKTTSHSLVDKIIKLIFI